MGYVFDRCWRDAGINVVPYIISLDSFSNDVSLCSGVVNTIKPPFVLTMGKKVTAAFCPETKQHKKVQKDGTEDESSLEKYAGSLLNSTLLQYPHYIIPQLPPDRVVANWQYKFIYTGIDLGHVREEFDFYKHNQKLQELPKRSLTIQPDYETLMEFLWECHKAQYLSTDIETIRPYKQSVHYGKHPGYPYTLSFADSPSRGISFSLWDYNDLQLFKIWRELDWLFENIPQIGQNYFTFDTHYLEALGFNICIGKCEDTMLIHQLLWPELPHKLQFLTKQYTRQPYYKDEGKGWSPKNKKQLMRYNALDTTITYEVFLGEQEELNDRPHLR
jgi:hypothetical protein